MGKKERKNKKVCLEKRNRLLGTRHKSPREQEARDAIVGLEECQGATKIMWGGSCVCVCVYRVGSAQKHVCMRGPRQCHSLESNGL